jgi:hypothetical protein
VHAVVGIDESMDSLFDLLVTNIGLLGERSLFVFIEPLPRWVLETINWVWFLDSSPWLWQDRFVIGGESVNFLNDSVITNVSLGLLCFSKGQPLE